MHRSTRPGRRPGRLERRPRTARPRSASSPRRAGAARGRGREGPTTRSTASSSRNGTDRRSLNRSISASSFRVAGRSGGCTIETFARLSGRMSDTRPGLVPLRSNSSRTCRVRSSSEPRLGRKIVAPTACSGAGWMRNASRICRDRLLRLHADERQLAAIDLDGDRRVVRAEVEERLGVEATGSARGWDRARSFDEGHLVDLVKRGLARRRPSPAPPRGGTSCPLPWRRA